VGQAAASVYNAHLDMASAAIVAINQRAQQRVANSTVLPASFKDQFRQDGDADVDSLRADLLDQSNPVFVSLSDTVKLQQERIAQLEAALLGENPTDPGILVSNPA